MAAIEITLSVKVDGAMLDGFPVVRRLEVDELERFNYQKVSGGGYVALPTGQLDEIQVLLVRSDKQVTLRLDGQSDAGIILNAGGLLLIMDADLDAGASTNATIDNGSGATARVKGLAGGT